ncbi:MAG: HAD family phosphatase [Solirubrobacteraceae bacterium]
MTAAPRRFDAVIFDNDGLLLDTETAWTRAEVTLFARRGREFTIEHKRLMLGSAGGLAEANLAAMLELPDDGPALFAELQALALEEIGRSATPRPGAIELLGRLRAARMPLGLASNSTRAFVDRALASAQIPPDTFDATCAGDEVAHPKPAPDIYLAVCEALGADPVRTAVLEDSPTGVAAGIAAGCYVIGIASTNGVVLHGASTVAASLSSVPL